MPDPAHLAGLSDLAKPSTLADLSDLADPDRPILLVLRHAKSSWRDPDLSDHDRPLNKRGRRTAPRAGRFLEGAGLVPDLVLASTALRARQTAELVVGAWDDDPAEVWYDEALYHADDDDLLQRLAQVPAGVTRVMVIGHNPGLEELVIRLTGRSEHLPTAALAVIGLNGTWANLAEAPPGELVCVWRPREQPDEEGEDPGE